MKILRVVFRDINIKDRQVLEKALERSLDGDL